MQVRNLFPLIVIGLLASFSNQSMAQCSPFDPNSHELENATSNDIVYEAFCVNPANPCTILYSIKGTLNGCSAVCIIPKTGSEVVVAVKVIQNGTMATAGQTGCSYTATAAGATDYTCPNGGTPTAMTLKYNGYTAGTVYEP